MAGPLQALPGVGGQLLPMGSKNSHAEVSPGRHRLQFHSLPGASSSLTSLLSWELALPQGREADSSLRGCWARLLWCHGCHRTASRPSYKGGPLALTNIPDCAKGYSWPIPATFSAHVEPAAFRRLNIPAGLRAPCL
ncbi:hypothetical protein VULLAG_LOCUS20387 [Vulpes lagopus]